MKLEPIDPETAFELYIAEKETFVADATLASHRSRLGFLLDWCDERNIENLNNLTGRKLQEFRLWRRNVGNLTKVSEKTQMDTLRVFVKWLESIDAVEQDLHKKIRSPDVSPEENSRDVMLEADNAEEMLTYLKRYEYASLRHVTATLLWHTMLRMGSVRALDIEDYDPEEQSLTLRHQPETDTPLKNKRQGERIIAVSNDVCLVLDDWVREKRPEVTDDYGRSPLLSTNHGRVGKATIRTYCYQRISRISLFDTTDDLPQPIRCFTIAVAVFKPETVQDDVLCYLSSTGLNHSCLDPLLTHRIICLSLLMSNMACQAPSSGHRPAKVRCPDDANTEQLNPLGLP